MKKYQNESLEKLINAMGDFKKSYNKLNEVISNNEIDINDIYSASEFYPFNRSFDELNIDIWVEETIDELSK